MVKASCHARRPRGMLLAEACVALALVGLMLGLASLLLSRYSVASDYYINYRRVQLGVESQIERPRGGALAVDDQPFEDEGGIAYTITAIDTPARWRPLTGVMVVGEFTGKHGRLIRVQARTMIHVPGDRTGGQP